MKPLHDQFAQLCESFPGATLTPVDGVHLVVIQTVTLPAGWSQPHTHVRFIVPNGYPYAPPDCFWSDFNLRLENGQMPQNAQVGNVVPGQSDAQTLWFSWHVNAAWKPGTCDLVTYVKIIRQRFEERR
jgi:hypothetical protein